MKRIALLIFITLITFSVSAQNKFAHVNFTELVQLMPEAYEARSQIETASKEAQQTFQAMVEEYQSKLAAYQKKASTWTAAIRESKEKELTDIQTRIQEFEQSVQQELQLQQTQLMAPIYNKAKEKVKKIAEAAGYIYVFDVSSVLYVDEKQSTDITLQARKALGIAPSKTIEALQAELQAKQQSLGAASPLAK